MKITKKMKKTILSLLAVFALALAVQIPAQAAGDVTMKGFTDNTITISWTKPTMNSSRTLNSYSVYDVSSQTYIASGTIGADMTEATISIPSGAGYSSWWRVDYNYTTKYSGAQSSSVGYTYVNTTPAKYSTGEFSSYNYYKNLKKVDFVVSKKSGSTGTQLEIRQLSNNKIKKTLTTSGNYFNTFQFSSNTSYKYRVRSYYTNSTTQQTYYGDWSSYRYFNAPAFTGKYSNASSGIKLTLKKGSGIAKYKVQISTKEKSGFKTVKTIKVGSKSKYSYTIRKCAGKKLKKGKTYYIRVVPVIKGNKKSDAYGTATVTFYR